MNPARRSALKAACRHLQRARREIKRGVTWMAVVELADAEYDIGKFVGLEMVPDGLDGDWRWRYLTIRAAAYTVRADIRLAIEADDDVFSTVEEREGLVLDIVRMLQPLGIAEVIEERARQIALLFLLDLAYRRIGGRRARAAAVAATRAIASAPPANDVPSVVDAGRS